MKAFESLIHMCTHNVYACMSMPTVKIWNQKLNILNYILFIITNLPLSLSGGTDLILKNRRSKTGLNFKKSKNKSNSLQLFDRINLSIYWDHFTVK